MHTDNTHLTKELGAIVEACTVAVAQLKELPESQLQRPPSPGAWSVLECVEHLNRYGDYYLPEIEKSIMSQPRTGPDANFRSGWLGNYFANLMRVKEQKLKKMKSPADKNPAGAALNALVLDRFLKQQDRLVQLLSDARNVNLIKAKVPISIAPWIRLRLGDTLRFFVYHVERHVQQARRAADAARLHAQTASDVTHPQ